MGRTEPKTSSCLVRPSRGDLVTFSTNNSPSANNKHKKRKATRQRSKKAAPEVVVLQRDWDHLSVEQRRRRARAGNQQESDPLQSMFQLENEKSKAAIIPGLEGLGGVLGALGDVANEPDENSDDGGSFMGPKEIDNDERDDLDLDVLASLGQLSLDKAEQTRGSESVLAMVGKENARPKNKQRGRVVLVEETSKQQRVGKTQSSASWGGRWRQGSRKQKDSALTLGDVAASSSPQQQESEESDHPASPQMQSANTTQSPGSPLDTPKTKNDRRRGRKGSFSPREGNTAQPRSSTKAKQLLGGVLRFTPKNKNSRKRHPVMTMAACPKTADMTPQPDEESSQGDFLDPIWSSDDGPRTHQRTPSKSESLVPDSPKPVQQKQSMSSLESSPMGATGGSFSEFLYESPAVSVQPRSKRPDHKPTPYRMDLDEIDAGGGEKADDLQQSEEQSTHVQEDDEAVPSSPLMLQQELVSSPAVASGDMEERSSPSSPAAAAPERNALENSSRTPSMASLKDEASAAGARDRTGPCSPGSSSETESTQTEEAAARPQQEAGFQVGQTGEHHSEACRNAPDEDSEVVRKRQLAQHEASFQNENSKLPAQSHIESSDAPSFEALVPDATQSPGIVNGPDQSKRSDADAEAETMDRSSQDPTPSRSPAEPLERLPSSSASSDGFQAQKLEPLECDSLMTNQAKRDPSPYVPKTAQQQTPEKLSFVESRPDPPSPIIRPRQGPVFPLAPRPDPPINAAASAAETATCNRDPTPCKKGADGAGLGSAETEEEMGNAHDVQEPVSEELPNENDTESDSSVYTNGAASSNMRSVHETKIPDATASHSSAPQPVCYFEVEECGVEHQPTEVFDSKQQDKTQTKSMSSDIAKGETGDSESTHTTVSDFAFEAEQGCETPEEFEGCGDDVSTLSDSIGGKRETLNLDAEEAVETDQAQDDGECSAPKRSRKQPDRFGTYATEEEIERKLRRRKKKPMRSSRRQKASGKSSFMREQADLESPTVVGSESQPRWATDENENSLQPKATERTVTSGHTATDSCSEDSSTDTDWSDAEVEKLRRAHSKVDPTASFFWDRVASMIPGRTGKDCSTKWYSLVATPKCQRSKSEAWVDQYRPWREDDIFDVSPNFRRSGRTLEYSEENGLDFGSAIKFELPRRHVPPAKQKAVGNKKHVSDIKRAMRQEKTKKAKGRPAAKTSRGLVRESVRDGEIEIKGSMSPGGTLNVKHVGDDNDDDDFWTDSDDN